MNGEEMVPNAQRKATSVTMKGCFTNKEFLDLFQLNPSSCVSPFVIHGYQIPEKWQGKKLQFLTSDGKTAIHFRGEIVGFEGNRPVFKFMPYDEPLKITDEITCTGVKIPVCFSVIDGDVILNGKLLD